MLDTKILLKVIYILPVFSLPCDLVVTTLSFILFFVPSYPWLNCSPLSHFDIILGVDRLSSDHALLNCYDKSLVFS